jgi:DNA polymerase-3 subunit delta'
MQALPVETVASLLEKFVPGVGDGEKEAISRYAEGSIGRALQFYGDDGMTLYRDLLSLAAQAPAVDIVKLHEMAEKLSRAEQSYETAREILTGWCQRLARLQARGETIVDVMPGDAAVFRKLADAFPPRHFLDTWEKMAQLFRQTEWSYLDRRQALIAAFLMLQNPDHPGLNL